MMLPLPECRWRGESRAGRCVCYSAKFVGAPNFISEDFCRKCYYIDHDKPPPPPRHLPCLHLGDATGQLAPCTTCAGKVQLKIFSCSLHGRCIPTKVSEDVADTRWCGLCNDYRGRDPFMPGSAEMLERANTFVDSIPAYPEGRYRGRGVVIAGGGERYFASLYVTVRALRHTGCRLPIQVWYLGRKNELPVHLERILTPYEVECVDADAIRQQHPARILNGWELKVFATLHSPFEELLFLDADCYPCRNPDFLFDNEEYRSKGAIFWPDMAAVDTRLKWEAFGVPDPERPGSVESGQYVLNKKTCWRSLNLTWFYNDNSDFYYRYCYGDKHTFEVAWTRLQQAFVMWSPQAVWSHVAYVHPGPDRQPIFVHRCADKFRFEDHQYVTHQNFAGPAYQPQLPLEQECWSWMAELADQMGLEIALPQLERDS